jgi:hypothetical protein
MAWVKGDEAVRKVELDRLLPLVRFPVMENSALAMMAEPLVAQHALMVQLMFETHPQFAQSGQVATCPRLRPRTGQRLGGGALAPLAFTRVSAAAYDISGEGGALLKGTGAANDHAAVCAGHVMCAGRHAAEFTVLFTVRFLGLARPDIDVAQHDAHRTDQFWGIMYHEGGLSHGGRHLIQWEGQKGFKRGDVVGLLLDCDAGTLTVKKNGARLGVAATGLTGELCWAVCMLGKAQVRIAAAHPATF